MLGNKIFAKGEEFTLVCSVTSKPASSISWLFNGADIKGNDNDVNISTNTFNGTNVTSILKKKNASLEDNGNFTCVVKNELFIQQELSSTLQSQVIGKYVSELMNCNCNLDDLVKNISKFIHSHMRTKMQSHTIKNYNPNCAPHLSV